MRSVKLLGQIFYVLQVREWVSFRFFLTVKQFSGLLYYTLVSSWQPSCACMLLKLYSIVYLFWASLMPLKMKYNSAILIKAVYEPILNHKRLLMF